MDYKWIIVYLIWILIYQAVLREACVFHSKLGFESESEGVRFLRVREDLPIGGEVLVLRAYPRNSVVLKSTDRTADQNYFRVKEINATTIQVLLDKSLEDLVDRDTPQNLLKFKIQCSSLAGRNEEQTSFMTVTVYIEDINDHFPKFINLPYAVTIDESTPVGTTIFHGITAFDRDKPNTPNSDVQYSIGHQDHGTGGSHFALESPHRPSVVLRRSVDYDEGIQEFEIPIIASDRGTPPRSSNTTLKIIIRDNDDLPPKFTEGVYRTRLNEFSPLTGKHIHIPLYFNPPIQAYDQDSLNSTLIYDIISGNERRLFKVKSSTGVIFLEKEIDLEEESLPGNTFVLQMETRQKDNPQKRALARVEIEVIDLNDNAPEFEVDLYNISIVENLPSGFSVLQVNAIDRDQGENAEFYYQLNNENPEGAFLIDPRTGWITVREQALLDRETIPSITMNVQAVEKAEPYDTRDSHAGMVEVEITLLDSNDNTPEFHMGNLYEFKIGVDSPVGFVVGHVTAKDPDYGKNGMVLYKLQQPRGSNSIPFKIDPKTGVLTVSGPLKKGRTALFVEASDQPVNPSERRFSLAVVTIEIVRKSFDEVIDFIGAPYEFWVGADVLVGTSVGQIRTTVDSDADGEYIMYDLLHSYSEGVPFAVEERSGTVTVIKELEEFNRNFYEFEAVATHYFMDKHYGELTRRASKTKKQLTYSGELLEIDEGVISETKNVLVTNVTIHVVSPDDEKGILMRGTSADPIEFRVKENVAGALIGQLLYNKNATKAITHQEASVTIKPTVTSSPSPFRTNRQLNSTKFNKASLKFDKVPKYRRRHRHTDSETSFFVSVAPSIIFDDLDFQESNYANSFVRSPLKPKTRIEATEINTHLDFESTVIYDSRKNNKSPSYFENFEPVKIKSKTKPNKSRNQARVARKFEVLSTTTEVPVSTYRPSEKIKKSKVNDTKEASSVIETARRKQDVEPLRFLIANQQDVTDMITITNDGTLMTVKGLDREQRDIYRLTVIAEYSRGFISGAGIYQVTVHVEDENDNAPLFNHHSFTGMISENSHLGTEVLINQPIIVKDNDVGVNAEFNIDLYGEGSHLFKVELVNGTSEAHNKSIMTSFDTFAISMNLEKSFASLQMMFMDASMASMTSEPHFVVRFVGPNILDRERESFYNLKLIARDSGGLSSEVNLGIFIVDVNDNAPMFEKIAVFKDSGIQILEYTDDMEIYFVDHIEPEVRQNMKNNANSTIKYENTSTGMLPFGDSVKDMVDRYHIGTPRQVKTNQNNTARIDKYRRSYKANSRSTFKRQTKKEKMSPLFSILENIPVGQTIVKITASDDDYEANAVIHYDIAAETFIPRKIIPRQMQQSPMKYFSIDRLSGELKINRPLPAESEVRVNISAMDVGNLADYTMIRFKVIDVNDHAPVFMKPWYTFDIEEGSYTNTRVGKVEATDEDFGQNANITYSLQSVERLPFIISPTSGVLVAAGDIDREMKSNYEFKIIAMDNGEKNFKLSSMAEVEINVLDVNDNAPEFTGYDEIYYEGGQYDLVDSDRKLSELTTIETNIQAKAQIKIPVYKAYLNRNTEPGTFVKQITAIDKDFAGNGNGLVMYSLHHNKLPYMFEIDSRDGIITTVSRFTPFHGYEHLNLTVIASDLGSPTRSSTALLLVNLQGEDFLNDDNPNNNLFPHKYYEVEVTENNPVPMVLLKINATSQFIADTFKWSIVPEMQVLKNEEFQIDPNNGTLWLIKSLDREIKDLYKLKIRAERVSREGRNLPVLMTYPIEGDRVQGLLQNEVRIVIRVGDENDNEPIFNGNGRPIVAVIPNSANFGFPVTRVKATDLDTGINAEIRYNLLNEPSRLFGIDSGTGNIRVLGPVSKLNQRVYGFDVKATDRRGADDGRSTIANVFVYVLDENRQVRLVLSGRPVEVEKEVDLLTKTLSDVTGLDVRVRMLEPHSGDPEQSTDVYLYAVDPKSNSVVDMDELQETIAVIDMSSLTPALPILELAQLGSARGLNRSHSHIGALNGPELASIILAVVIFAGGLATAFCIVCVRYKRRRTILPDASYSVGRASSTLRTGISKSSYNGKKMAPPLPPGPPYYTHQSGNTRERVREYIDVPLPQSVLNANFNILDHDTGCLRFNQIHSGHQSLNLDNSANSLHSSGRDSGLDLSRERSESPSRMQQQQQQQQQQQHQQLSRSRDRRNKENIQSAKNKNKCQCGQSELNVCSGEESTDSYEDSLKNNEIERRTSLPRAQGFRRSVRNGISSRGIRHSFSGVRDDLVQTSPGPLHRSRQMGHIRNSMTDLEERLRNLERSFREPFLLNNSRC